ncbi:NAD(P)-binding protein [Deinococcus malanensis]|uniref:NAD(P)-binding protein n=1 Tax=Deinococcus malanensis TaxID=1706855 RepID=UPI003636A40E
MSALLAARGHQVTVYERDRAGGKLRRIQLGGLTFDTGPSLFTFPEVWQAYLARLQEADPLRLTRLPGGLGIHHTPSEPCLCRSPGPSALRGLATIYAGCCATSFTPDCPAHHASPAA